METKNWKLVFFSILVCVFGSAHSQTMEEISASEFVNKMTPIVQKMNKDDFSMKFKKEIFKDKKSPDLVSQSFGIIYHGKGKVYRSQNDGITIIQNDQLYVVIDSLERIIQIAEPDTNFNPGAAIANFNKETLKQYKLFHYTNLGYDLYKIVPSNLAEGIIEYYVNTKLQVIYKMIISYPPANYFSENVEDETLEEPYAIVLYEAMSSLSKTEKIEFFNLDSILLPIENGRYKLVDTFEGFELYDARYITTN